MKKRTLNELRQSKDFGYRPPSPSKDNPKFELSPDTNSKSTKPRSCKTRWDTFIS